MGTYTITAKEFWQSVLILGEDDCWLWKKSRNRQGYGKARLFKRSMPAHRAAYILIHGDIPNDIFVLHKCDNPPCCNPNHLFAGTHTDNMQDMVKKGRKDYVGGERHGMVKLTLEQVREIRNPDMNIGLSQREVSKKYEVKQQTISRIRSGKRWMRDK